MKYKCPFTDTVQKFPIKHISYKIYFHSFLCFFMFSEHCKVIFHNAKTLHPIPESYIS